MTGHSPCAAEAPTGSPLGPACARKTRIPLGGAPPAPRKICSSSRRAEESRDLWDCCLWKPSAWSRGDTTQEESALRNVDALLHALEEDYLRTVRLGGVCSSDRAAGTAAAGDALASDAESATHRILRGGGADVLDLDSALSFRRRGSPAGMRGECDLLRERAAFGVRARTRNGGSPGRGLESRHRDRSHLRETAFERPAFTLCELESSQECSQALLRHPTFSETGAAAAEAPFGLESPGGRRAESDRDGGFEIGVYQTLPSSASGSEAPSSPRSDLGDAETPWLSPAVLPGPVPQALAAPLGGSLPTLGLAPARRTRRVRTFPVDSMRTGQARDRSLGARDGLPLSSEASASCSPAQLHVSQAGATAASCFCASPGPMRPQSAPGALSWSRTHTETPAHGMGGGPPEGDGLFAPIEGLQRGAWDYDTVTEASPASVGAASFVGDGTGVLPPLETSHGAICWEAGLAPCPVDCSDEQGGSLDASEGSWTSSSWDAGDSLKEEVADDLSSGSAQPGVRMEGRRPRLRGGLGSRRKSKGETLRLQSPRGKPLFGATRWGPRSSPDFPPRGGGRPAWGPGVPTAFQTRGPLPPEQAGHQTHVDSSATIWIAGRTAAVQGVRDEEARDRAPAVPSGAATASDGEPRPPIQTEHEENCASSETSGSKARAWTIRIRPRMSDAGECPAARERSRDPKDAGSAGRPEVPAEGPRDPSDSTFRAESLQTDACTEQTEESKERDLEIIRKTMERLTLWPSWMKEDLGRSPPK
ncbi:hypothetical protein BESB_069080 [Besnoitia besnoiti]|uniref:Uncharacterized protein n=1 Tax=Besnoitia besnoiti TaxID=94643 RepID=A0A2A9MA59_BESBE|nr:hypothetical protein BESB_069080 [Besnoitia besnoiti]PFH34875.1 hypothetical protein BESB_069080 [Besnoitia besnoiti]